MVIRPRDDLQRIISRINSRNISDAVWTGGGTALSAVAGLATVRLLATFVEPESYGRAALVLGLVGLLQSLLAGPFLIVHLRRYFESLKYGYAQLFRTSTLRAVTLIAALMVAAYFLVALGFKLLNLGDVYLALLIPAALVLVSQPLLTVQTSYLEANREYRRLAFAPAASKVFLLVAAWVLLSFEFFGDDSSIVLANAIGALLAIPLAYSSVPPNQGGEGRPELLAGFWRVAIPLQVGYLGGWIIASSDRYFLDFFRGSADVGIYVLNYGLWALPFTMLNGWLELLSRARVYASAASGEWERVRRLVWARAGVGTLLAVGGCVVLYFASRKIAEVLIGERFWYSHLLVLVLSVGHIFFVIGNAFVSYFLAKEKPESLRSVTLIAAGFNLTLNALAIPHYGLIGAAVSTFCSYLVWAIILGVKMERDYFHTRSNESQR